LVRKAELLAAIEVEGREAMSMVATPRLLAPAPC